MTTSCEAAGGAMVHDVVQDHPHVRRSDLQRGRFVARFARDAADLQAAGQLRHLCFVQQAGRADLPGGVEQDSFDAQCDHVLIEEAASGRLVCCFRIMLLPDGAALGQSYSAQYYDLTDMAGFAAPMAELGRFCTAPDGADADVLRLAWGVLARFVDDSGVALLFGCSSFAGTDPAAYGQAFGVLASQYQAPDRWTPAVKADKVHRYAAQLPEGFDPRGASKAAAAQLPPLLKTYLSMGGWVSDHAVIDEAMNTLHVFTGLEIAAIPPARARALRAIAE